MKRMIFLLKKHKKDEVVNAEILNQVVGIPFENCHENSLHDFLEEWFGKVLEELQLEQLCHAMYIIENFAVCYDPMAKYMEKLCSRNGGLYVCSKYQISHHNLLTLTSSFLIKHVEEAQSLDQLLDWLHWKSEFT